MKKYYAAILGLTGLLLVSATGCGGKNMAGGYAADCAAEEAAMDTAASVQESAEYAAGEMDDGAILSENGIEPVAETGRKLIRTIRLEMQTKEFDAVIEGLTKNVQEMDCYI